MSEVFQHSELISDTNLQLGLGQSDASVELILKIQVVPVFYTREGSSEDKLRHIKT